MPTEPPHPGVNGLPAFEESGVADGGLIVLIHGSLDRMGGMALLARALNGSCRVLRYDRRGYGRSWPHDGPFAVSNQVDDLEALLAGRRAVLIGHSYGGNVALAAAARLGDQITGVSTYESPLSWQRWWPGTTAGAMSLDGGVEGAAERFMIGLIGRDRWNALPERTRDARRREGLALTSELGSLRQAAPWDPDDIDCRVLCGYGSRGREHHRQGAEWLAKNLKNASLVCLDGAGHGAPTSHAGEMARLLVLPHLAE